MINWCVEILNEKVQKEIEAFPRDMRAHLQKIVELLQEFGPHHLGEPYIKPLKSKLWEIRCKGRDGIGRAVYMASSGKKLIILVAFIKKTPKTPQKILELALKRAKDIKNDS